MTTFLIEKEPGFGETRPGLRIPGKLDKMGYKGVETTEMILDGVAVAGEDVLGGPDKRGQGFYQMMDGIEVGRVNVAARGLRHLDPGLRAGRRLRPAAQGLRQADRRAPGDRLQAGRDGAPRSRPRT